MKKIIALFLSVIMCFSLSIVVSAETQTLTFPMATTEGSVIFKGVAGFNCNVEPDVVAEDFIILKETGEMPALTNVKLLVTGDKGRSYVENAEYQFINYYDALCTERARENEGMYWKLNIAKDVAYLGDFLADSYSRIYTIAIEVEGKMTVTKEEDYTKWANNGAIEGLTFDILKGFTYGGYITDTIEATALNVNKFEYITKSVKFDFPMIYNTDENGDGNITRNEVYCLSRSAFGGGEGVFGFEGLASQVGEFFNKKDNGTITFHVTTAPATYSQLWSAGGITSTQTGLLNNYSNSNGVLIGLFFNYDKTGSLVSTATIDEDGNIVFDISDVLNDIGSNSIATIHSIYYGLVGGYTYTNELAKGLKIDRVTLSYSEEDEEMVDECEIVEDVEEEVIVDVSDEDSEEVEEEEEVIIEDEDEVEIVPDVEIEPVVEEPETEVELIASDADAVDEDTNPGTGVAMLVIPAAISAIAVFAMRKRK